MRPASQLDFSIVIESRPVLLPHRSSLVRHPRRQVSIHGQSWSVAILSLSAVVRMALVTVPAGDERMNQIENAIGVGGGAATGFPSSSLLTHPPGAVRRPQAGS